MSRKINIALGFDKNYLPYAGTTIKSILETNKENEIHFYIMIDNSINIIDIFFLKRMIEKSDKSVEFINMKKRFKNLDTNGWSIAMYYPLVLPSLCNDEKVLFLDSDIIVTGDLTELYNTNLEGYLCGAVRDYGLITYINNNSKAKIHNNKQMSICKYFTDIRKWNKEDLKKYCNSGMLLFNLNEMRKNNTEKQMLKVIKEGALMFPDQDCINICCQEKIKILPMQYNFQIMVPNIYNGIYENDKIEYTSWLSSTETLPLIIHYLAKPWKETQEIHFRKLYYQYKNKTIWKFHIDKILRKKLLRLKFSEKESYLYILNKKILHFGKTNSEASSLHF